MTLKDHITYLGAHFALANLIAVAWCAVGRPRYAFGGVAVYVLIISVMYPRMVRQMNARRDQTERDMEEFRALLNEEARKVGRQLTNLTGSPFPFAGRSPDMH